MNAGRGGEGEMRGGYPKLQINGLASKGIDIQLHLWREGQSDLRESRNKSAVQMMIVLIYCSISLYSNET